jgi:hypothetical protein
MNLVKFEITVSYNGVARDLSVESHENKAAVLQRAIQLFSITQQPHLMSLFFENGTLVPEQVSAEAAGLKAGIKVYLRQNVAKGGSR